MTVAGGGTVTSPADGAVLGELPWLDVAAVAPMVAAARDALATWRAVAPHARAAILRRAASALEARADELGHLHAAESGKVLGQAVGEVRGAAALIEANAHLAVTTAGQVAPTGAVPRTERDLTIVERVPLGVVVCVIPFNFPVELTVEKAAAALAAGNVVIVKPPPQNPLATAATVATLDAAGLPPGVLQLAPGGTDVAAALCAADGVDAVSLTGSVGAGVAVARATAATLRPLHLELGGNGAAIVLPDDDLDGGYVDHVVAETLAGRLLMNGQACAATKRVLAVGDTAGPLVERLTAALGEVAVGHPCDPASRVGPLIDAAAAERVAAQVRAAVADGARLALGSGAADRAWFEPTVLADVPPDAAVAIDDEIFGPVVTVVPVPDAAAAVAVANATSLRLTASVFGTDLRAAMAVAEQLDFGGVVVGGTNNYRPPVVPFGGVGLAGAGREGIGYTYEELTRSRFIALRNFRPAPAVVPGAVGG